MPIHATKSNPFALEPGRAVAADAPRGTPALPGGLANWRALRGLAERALGLAELHRLYRDAPEGGHRSFCQRALDMLNVTMDVPAETTHIPASGAAILVANHPHGALDGLLLLALVLRLRHDVRIVGNHLLARIPELREYAIFVDPFERRTSTGANARGVREALRWLAEGGALIVFPSGEVAHRLDADGTTLDPPWRTSVAWLARRSSAPVVPVFIEGRNSRAFRWAGLVHPLLRTAMLPRELLRTRGTSVRVSIGASIPAERLEALSDDGARVEYLRLRTFALSARRAAPGGDARHQRLADSPVVAAVPVERLLDDIRSLSDDRCLLRSGPFDVFCAPAAELPRVLPEIGRLREVTFRRAGEGTGLACDLDAFDDAYEHLFVWHRERRQIVGAYRIGCTDRLVAARGPAALYTRTLFRYGHRFHAALGPALELGRSFVRAEYQRDYSALLLLWKGIGRFVAARPRYRQLFGPVSISADYHPASRRVMARTLTSARYVSPLARLVVAKRPLRDVCETDAESVRARSRSVEELNALVAELEPDGKGIPVLLRQYLRLNGRLLSFSVDPAFGFVMDGLMVVDLCDVDRATLQRYLGSDGAARFLAYHAAGTADVAYEPAVATA